jgi:hypothetical protein
MNRALRLPTVLLIGLTGLTACGDSSSTSGLPNVTVPAAAAECAATYKALTTSLVSGLVPGSKVDFEKVLADTQAAVPDELKGEVETMAKALVDIGKKVKDNPTDLNALKELGNALKSADVQNATNALKTYFEGGCSTGA